MDPAAFRSHFEVEPPDIAQDAALAALRIAVSDGQGARAALAGAGVASVESLGRLIVGPLHAMGATIVFERE